MCASRPVSLPVVAIRSSLPEAQRTAIEQALASLSRSSDSQSILAGLAIDRLQRMPMATPRSTRAGLLRPATGATAVSKSRYDGQHRRAASPAARTGSGPVFSGCRSARPAHSPAADWRQHREQCARITGSQ